MIAKFLREDVVDLTTLVSTINDQITIMSQRESDINGIGEHTRSYFGTEKTFKSINQAMVTDFREYADSIFDSIDLSQVELNKNAIEVLNGDETVTGSVLKYLVLIKDQADVYVDDLLTDLEEGRITNIENLMQVINGDDAVENSVRWVLKTVVDGAPENFDTLKEIADYLAENGDFVVRATQLIQSNIAVAKAELLGTAEEEFKSLSEIKNKIDGLFIEGGDLNTFVSIVETATTSHTDDVFATALTKEDNLLSVASIPATRENLDVYSKAESLKEANKVINDYPQKYNEILTPANKIVRLVKAECKEEDLELGGMAMVVFPDEQNVTRFVPLLEGPGFNEFTLNSDNVDVSNTQVKVEYYSSTPLVNGELPIETEEETYLPLDLD